MKYESKKGGSASNDYQHDVFVVDWAYVEHKDKK